MANGLPNPVVVVPGITATYLRDDYPLPPELIWTVLTKDYARSTLHPDDRRYESREPARVRPGQIFEVAYRELVDELRHNLSPREDTPVPVYPFGYDWRQPLRASARQLAAFVDEVADRTLLQRHYFDSGYRAAPRVDLIGHSMGGLIVAACAAEQARQGGAAQRKIGKVATIATPYRGSLEAVLKIATGMADLGETDSSSREREAARLTPALYHLLPRFADAIDYGPGVPALPELFFSLDAWQPSVVATLTEFVRLHGRDAAIAADIEKARALAATLFRALLDDAREFLDDLDKLDLAAAGLAPNDWLCIAGIGRPTRQRIRVELGDAKEMVFVVDRSQMEDGYATTKQPGPKRARTGDGTVTFHGACPAFIPRERLVCYSPDDFGYWEVQDRVLVRIGGFHGILPNMDVIHRTIVRFLTGRADPRGNTWGRPPPDVTAAKWQPPLALSPR